MNVFTSHTAKALSGLAFLLCLSNVTVATANEIPEEYKDAWQDLQNAAVRHENTLAGFGDVSASDAIKRYLDSHLYQCGGNVLVLIALRVDNKINAGLAEFKGFQIGGWNADEIELFKAELRLNELSDSKARELFDNLRLTRAGGNPIIFTADDSDIADISAANGVEGFASVDPDYTMWRVRLIAPEVSAWSDWVERGQRANGVYNPLGKLALIKVRGKWTIDPAKVVKLKDSMDQNLTASVWSDVFSNEGRGMDKVCDEVSSNPK